ncbi:pyridoxamine 5'-phosphate oxidase family protein [Synoicihabitans lomoniglobus]|uniref:Pyridoxamine 5'-phosphate oxidase family protein n=1 Tax=Synoicihabitans lomoniglobus TaxID=2909285 RepID=A0AAE9ZS83_9BACT|nr:pyridoxamine 5'-phosphate oxidase family protein [Opitutaceae bacterium LMO-M01]WED64275.1 pyridoxamine 5'-phosphate oxidase family protein [Opitutaceae bacterium LMO-M01]
MGQQYTAIPEKQVAFIREQKIFFVGTAGVDTRVNVSPKGMDSLRVLSANRVIWLNVTGSGNETAAHLLEQSRMTIMFCAMVGAPLILRLYGNAKAVHPRDPEWAELYGQFNPLPGARQMFDLTVDLVQTSCGMAVPNLEYKADRSLLSDWATKKGPEGIRDYWTEKNQTSLDGKPTRIFGAAE